MKLPNLLIVRYVFGGVLNLLCKAIDPGRIILRECYFTLHPITGQEGVYMWLIPVNPSAAHLVLETSYFRRPGPSSDAVSRLQE